MLANNWNKSVQININYDVIILHYWTFVKFGPFWSEPSFLLFMCYTASHQKAI